MVTWGVIGACRYKGKGQIGEVRGGLVMVRIRGLGGEMGNGMVLWCLVRGGQRSKR